MSKNQLAKSIIDNVGGIDNVSGLTHCATRLRFNLKDDSKANADDLKDLSKVVGVVNQGGQYQVIIGPDVKNVYKSITDDYSIGETKPVEDKEEKKSVVSKVLDTIVGIFVPIVPALTGAGMLKAVLTLLVLVGLVSSKSQTYQILNFMGDAAFYFLPVLIGNSAAKKFKVNQYVGMSIGAILIYPTFIQMVNQAQANHTGINLFGVPVTLATYSSSVIPIILAMWFMSYVEPFIDKHMPSAIKLFMTPLLTLMIVGFSTLTFIGPIGYWLGSILGVFFSFLDVHVQWLVPLLVGTFTPLLVMTGMHYGLIPLGINQLATQGFDSIAGPGMMVSNIAQGGAALAVGIQSKNKKTKELGLSTSISALAGITEPALYGVNMKFKKPLISSMIGGGIAGLFIGIFGTVRYAQVAPGLFALPSFIGTKGWSNFIYAVIGCAISFVVSFVAQLIIGIEEQTDPDKTEKNDKNTKLKDVVKNKIPDTLSSPLHGVVTSLKEVPDQVFSSGAMGQGIAIEPEDGKVYAPADGTITAVFDSNHAIGIKTNNGAEILIHIGLETVSLNGKGFKRFVEKDQQIKKGDLLLDANLDFIKEHHLKTITSIVVTNSNDYKNITALSKLKEINVGDSLLNIA